MKPIALDCKFQAHIILYCKGYYQQNNVSFHEGLRRIWAVRCGLSLEHVNERFDEYIADELYRIIALTKPKRIPYLIETIHKELTKTLLFDFEKERTAIEKLISVYKNELMMLQVKDKVNKNYRTLVKLPPPQKRLFSRIVKGNFKYSDYNKVKY